PVPPALVPAAPVPTDRAAAGGGPPAARGPAVAAACSLMGHAPARPPAPRHTGPRMGMTRSPTGWVTAPSSRQVRLPARITPRGNSLSGTTPRPAGVTLGA